MRWRVWHAVRLALIICLPLVAAGAPLRLFPIFLLAVPVADVCRDREMWHDINRGYLARDFWEAVRWIVGVAAVVAALIYWWRQV